VPGPRAHPRIVTAVVGLALAFALATAGCTVASSHAAAPDDAVRHRVLLVGDSLMGQTAPFVDEPLDRAGWQVDVVDAHQNGSGVLGPVGDAPDSLSYVREQLALHPDVDTVVVEWAGACSTCGSADPAYGSPDFYTAWRTQATRIIDELRAHRDRRGELLHVAWVKSPPMPGTRTDSEPYQLGAEVAAVLARIDQEELGPAAGPVTPDWWAALGDSDGHYRESLEYDGAPHPVRADDGVHLTEDGARRTGRWTAVALARLWS
jgi:hypothetical protein